MLLVDDRPLVSEIWWKCRDDAHDSVGLTLETVNDLVSRDRAVPNLLGATRDQLRLGYRAYTPSRRSRLGFSRGESWLVM